MHDQACTGAPWRLQNGKAPVLQERHDLSLNMLCLQNRLAWRQLLALSQDPILNGNRAGVTNAVVWCRTPVLLVGSGQDRLLPSLSEQTRLQRLLPNAQRLVLPDSGHTALLEVTPLPVLHCTIATACSWQAQEHEQQMPLRHLLHATLVSASSPACSWQNGQEKMSSMDCRFWLTWGLQASLLGA